ncbi:hypothetical protein CW735_12320 [Alteromonas sp. MB-3u-76]|uniref:hypothetical protein n=1 Tax=unclassified Alteromonas TaxID=2614992 RepID=UPI0005097198|nr:MULTISPECIES: hypothetical protein [unclassified Alteromonas]AUC88874.1 hypothetical protein CW735_12320 [Alteromonas sp. MB-3u-76]
METIKELVNKQLEELHARYSHLSDKKKVKFYRSMLLSFGKERKENLDKLGEAEEMLRHFLEVETGLSMTIDGLNEKVEELEAKVKK